VNAPQRTIRGINFAAFPIRRDRAGARKVLDEFCASENRLPKQGRTLYLCIPMSGTVIFENIGGDCFNITAEKM